MIIPKYIPILILTSNLNLKNDKLNDSSILIKKILLKFTLFNYIEKITFDTYLIFVIIIFLSEIIFVFYIIKYLYFFKRNKKNIKLEIYPKIMFYINSLFSQFLCEFFSFIFIIIFRKKLDYNIIQNENSFPILKQNNINIYLLIVLSIFHSLGILFLLFFTFYSFIIVNSVYKTTLNTLNIKHRQIFYNFVLLNFYSSFYYYEIVFNQNLRKVIKVFFILLIFTFLIIEILIWHFYFEKENKLTYLCRFLNEYNLISIVVNFLLSFHSFNFKQWEILIILFINFLITYLFLNLLMYLREYHFLKKSEYYLFNELEISNLNETLESFIFILDKIYSIQTKEKGIIDLIQISKKHMKNCLNENCKCKLIEFIPKWNTKINEEYSIKFFQGFGFLMDSTFINVEIYNNFKFILFLIEYFSHTKENIVFSLCFCLTHLSSNLKTFNYIDYFELYNLTLHYIELLNNKEKENYNEIKFKSLYDNIQERIVFKKNIIKYCNNINNIIDSKIKFENSLKFEIDDFQNEILDINSVFINRNFFLIILNQLKELKKISDVVHHNLIKNHSTKKLIDFHYIIFLFYYIFCDNIPEKIIDSFNTLLNGDSFKNISLNEMNKKFDLIIENYISSVEKHNYMIIGCSNGIKIKYISPYLSNKLGYNSTKIKNEDFYNLFPKELREPHTKSMLNYITIHQNFYIKKKIFLFDKNENSFKFFMKSCALPILSKHLNIIIEFFLRKKNDVFFILDQDFHQISLSKTLEKEYNINLDLLRKCDTELIDLFALHKNNIKKSFQYSLNIIDKKNKNLKHDVLEYYNSLLFNLNNSLYDKYYQDLNYKVNKNSFRFIHRRVNSLLKDKDKKFQNKEVFKAEISKISFLQNIIKSLSKLNDNLSKENKIQTLIDTILNLNSNTEQPINKKEPLKKKISNGSFLMNQNDSSIIIELICKIKFIYNIPIYIFKLIEKEGKKKNENFDINIQKIINKRTQLMKNNNKNPLFSPLRKYSDKSQKLLFISPKTSTMNIKHINSFNNVSPLPITQNEKIKDKDFNEDNFIDIFQEKEEKRNIFKILINIEKLLVTLSVIITIYLFYLKNNYINKVDVINDFFGRITFMRDKITTLYSNLISGIYERKRLTEMNLTKENYHLHIYSTIYFLQDAKIRFWNGAFMYDKYLSKNRINILFSNFIKNTKNWEIKIESSDFFPELNYILFLVTQSLNEKFNLKKFEEDINQLFHKNYLKNPKKFINTFFMKSFFYLYNNFNLNFNVMMSELKEKISSDLFNYLSKGQRKIYLFDILWIVIDIFIFIDAFFIFNYFNRNIFKIIISLFYNGNKISKNSEKNKYENFYMKKKIKSYLDLIDNFNIETKNYLNSFQNDYTNSIQTSTISIFNTQNIFKFQEENQQSIVSNLNNNNINQSSNISFINNSLMNNTNNNLLNNSSILNEDMNNNKKSKNSKKKKVKNHKEKKNNNNKKVKKEILITPETLLTFLMKKTIILSHIILISFIILLMISMIIGYFHFFSSTYYENKVRNLNNIFIVFVDFFFEIPYIFNNIRISIFIGEPIFNFMNNLSIHYNEIQKKFFKQTSSSYFKTYENIYFLYEQLNLQMNSTNINLNYLCNNNSLCLNFLKKKNGYCSGNIILCHQLMYQKYITIINDIKSFNYNFTIDSLKIFSDRNDFTSLQQYSEFVFNQIQYKFYVCLTLDFEKFKKFMNRLNIILNSLLFGFQFILLSIFFLIMGYNMFNTVKYAKNGKKLFKTAFFKDSINYY